MNEYINLEDEFLGDLRETQRVILCIGQKGSGKTTLLNSFLKYALINNLYDTYHLIIPSYNYEMQDSYSYLKNQYNCFIYPTYTENVSKRVLKDREQQKRILFMIDDASGFNIDDNSFKLLVTTSRHGKSKNHEHGGVCVFMCMHSARRIMKPIIRNNCDYIFIFQMNNRKLLESLYEEYFSMIFDKLKDFVADYKNAMQTKYNSMLYSNQTTTLDNNVVGWNLINEMQQIKELPQQGKKHEKKKEQKEAKEEKTRSRLQPQLFNHKKITFNRYEKSTNNR